MENFLNYYTYCNIDDTINKVIINFKYGFKEVVPSNVIDNIDYIKIYKEFKILFINFDISKKEEILEFIQELTSKQTLTIICKLSNALILEALNLLNYINNVDLIKFYIFTEEENTKLPLFNLDILLKK